MQHDITIGPIRPTDTLSILGIQMQNHRSSLKLDEQKDGYVTLLTPPVYLGRHDVRNHIHVARHKHELLQGKIAGYIISANKDTVHGHEALTAFKNKLEEVGYHNPAIIVQVCVARDHAGERSGVGKKLYEHMEKNLHRTQHEWLMTQVDSNNSTAHRFYRSLEFKAVGQAYEDEYGNIMTIMGKQLG